MGAFFLALIFGHIVQATHRFDYPVYVVGAVLIVGCLLWLAIDAEKQLPEMGGWVERRKTLGRPVTVQKVQYL